MICSCPCGREFTPKRRNQRYRSPECKERARRQRSVIVRLSAREHRRVQASRARHKSPVRRGNHLLAPYGAVEGRQALYEANLAFSHQAAPGNVKGLLARVAVISPQVMLRLAPSIREDAAAGRPSCNWCGYSCEDRASCKILVQEGEK